jgi:hypothetical protein
MMHDNSPEPYPTYISHTIPTIVPINLKNITPKKPRLQSKYSTDYNDIFQTNYKYNTSHQTEPTYPKLKLQEPNKDDIGRLVRIEPTDPKSKLQEPYKDDMDKLDRTEITDPKLQEHEMYDINEDQPRYSDIDMYDEDLDILDEMRSMNITSKFEEPLIYDISDTYDKDLDILDELRLTKQFNIEPKFEEQPIYDNPNVHDEQRETLNGTTVTKTVDMESQFEEPTVTKTVDMESQFEKPLIYNNLNTDDIHSKHEPTDPKSRVTNQFTELSEYDTSSQTSDLSYKLELCVLENNARDYVYNIERDEYINMYFDFIKYSIHTNIIKKTDNLTDTEITKNTSQEDLVQLIKKLEYRLNKYNTIEEHDILKKEMDDLKYKFNNLSENKQVTINSMQETPELDFDIENTSIVEQPSINTTSVQNELNLPHIKEIKQQLTTLYEQLLQKIVDNSTEIAQVNSTTTLNQTYLVDIVKKIELLSFKIDELDELKKQFSEQATKADLQQLYDITQDIKKSIINIKSENISLKESDILKSIENVQFYLLEIKTVNEEQFKNINIKNDEQNIHIKKLNQQLEQHVQVAENTKSKLNILSEEILPNIKSNTIAITKISEDLATYINKNTHINKETHYNMEKILEILQQTGKNKIPLNKDNNTQINKETHTNMEKILKILQQITENETPLNKDSASKINKETHHNIEKIFEILKQIKENEPPLNKNNTVQINKEIQNNIEQILKILQQIKENATSVDKGKHVIIPQNIPTVNDKRIQSSLTTEEYTKKPVTYKSVSNADSDSDSDIQDELQIILKKKQFENILSKIYEDEELSKLLKKIQKSSNTPSSSNNTRNKKIFKILVDIVHEMKK